MFTNKTMTTGTTRIATLCRIKRCACGAAAASMSVVLLAACSSGGHTGSGAGGQSAGSTLASKDGLTTESTSLGTVAADAAGRTLYELVGDTPSHATCTGSCLSIWPASTSHGKQVVLNGHPAFTFSEDNAPGQVNGQGVTDTWGTWYALDSAGRPITGKVAPAGGSSGSGTSGSGGGYGY